MEQKQIMLPEVTPFAGFNSAVEGVKTKLGKASGLVTSSFETIIKALSDLKARQEELTAAAAKNEIARKAVEENAREIGSASDFAKNQEVAVKSVNDELVKMLAELSAKISAAVETPATAKVEESAEKAVAEPVVMTAKELSVTKPVTKVGVTEVALETEEGGAIKVGPSKGGKGGRGFFGGRPVIA